MALTIHNIKYWAKMLSGQSVNHAPQGLGQFFKPNEIKGYFNDLRNKVLLQPNLIDNGELPLVTNNYDEKIIFPVAIFQYGLGAFDLYLESLDVRYFNKFIQCADWALDHQEDAGSWDNFSAMRENIPPYGAMCQGEAASLMVRAYIQTGDMRYKIAAKKAIDFMLKPINQGGTSVYDGEEIHLLECTHASEILNGAIFAFFGLYDYCIIENNERYQILKQKVFETIVGSLCRYDRDYWSNYNIDGNISSPFYHRLHIAQLEALTLISSDLRIIQTLHHFERYQKNILYRCRAFIVKTLQKISE